MSTCVLRSKDSSLSRKTVSSRQWFPRWDPGPQSEEGGVQWGGIHEPGLLTYQAHFGGFASFFFFFFQRDKDFNDDLNQSTSPKKALLALVEVVNEFTEVSVQKHLRSAPK